MFMSEIITSEQFVYMTTILVFKDCCNKWIKQDFTSAAIDKYNVQYQLIRESQVIQYFEKSDTSVRFLQPKCFEHNNQLKAKWVYNLSMCTLERETPVSAVVALGVDDETNCIVPKAIALFSVAEVLERFMIKAIQAPNRVNRAFFNMLQLSYDIEIHKIRLLVRYLKGVTKDQYDDAYKIQIQKKIKSNKKYRRLIEQYNEQLEIFNRTKKSDVEREYDKFINTIKTLYVSKSKTMGLKNCQNCYGYIGYKTHELMRTVMDLEGRSDMVDVLNRIKNVCDIKPTEDRGITSYNYRYYDDSRPIKFENFIVSLPFASLVNDFFTRYYGFPEDLQKLCIRSWELTIQHEFGHVLSFLDFEKKETPIPDVLAFLDSDDTARDEYNKFCEGAAGNPKISVQDLNRKYCELPLEKLANKYGGVDADEYDRIDEAFAAYGESIMKQNDKFTWLF